MTQLKSKPAVGKLFRRAITIEKSSTRAFEPDADGLYDISICSDEPFQRLFGWEVLKVSPEALDINRLKNGAAVLWNHNPDSQIGVVEDFYFDGSVGRAKVRFSPNSQMGKEVEADVRDGIKRHVSIGYQVFEWSLGEPGPDGVDIWTATKWEIYETSIVSIPADTTVGVGRSLETVEVEKEQTEEQPVEIVVEEKAVENSSDTLRIAEDTTDSALPRKDTADNTLSEMEKSTMPEETKPDNNKELARIAELANEHKMTDKLPVWIQENRSYESVAAEILASRKTEPVKPYELSKKETREFNLVDAYLATSQGRRTFAHELSEQAAKDAGMSLSSPTNLFFGLRSPVIPSRVLRTMTRAALNANMDGLTGDAGEFVHTGLVSFETALREASIIGQLGIPVVPGDGMIFTVPRISASVAPQYPNELGTTAAINPGTDSLTFKPRTATLNFQYSRQLGIMNNPHSMGDILAQEMTELFLNEVEKGAFGISGSNTPAGCFGSTGATVITATGSVTLAHFRTLIQTAEQQNANNIQAVMSPACYTDIIVSGAAAGFNPVTNYSRFGADVWGTPVVRSSRVPTTLNGIASAWGGTKHGMAAGDFSKIMVAVWGVEVFANQYSNAAIGQVGLHGLLYHDAQLRNDSAIVLHKNAR